MKKRYENKGSISFIAVMIIVLLLATSAKAFHDYYRFITQQTQLRQDKFKALYLALAAEQYAIQQIQQIPPVLQGKGTLEGGHYFFQAKQIKPFVFQVECKGKTKKGSPAIIQLTVKRAFKEFSVLGRKEL